MNVDSAGLHGHRSMFLTMQVQVRFQQTIYIRITLVLAW